MDAIDDPGTIIVPSTLFAYGGGYQLASQIAPNQGYWLLTTASGNVTLACTEITATKRSPSVPETPEGFGALTVRDGEGHRQQLFFGASLDEASHRLRYAMPPASSQLRFDARFADDSRLAEGEEALIRVQATVFPIQLEIDALPAAGTGPFEIQELVRGKVVATHVAVERDAIVLSSDEVEMLRIRRQLTSAESLPETFALHGNYPNPFNPTTNIVFDLPEAAEVRIDVYDLLGRRVMALDATPFDAGAARQLAIDASSLASGTYIYRLRADLATGAQVHTGRLTLLK
jgi:Secretion system C-terminal sorting domain